MKKEEEGRRRREKKGSRKEQTYVTHSRIHTPILTLIYIPIHTALYTQASSTGHQPPSPHLPLEQKKNMPSSLPLLSPSHFLPLP
jgi:hypothetical protein